MSSPVTGLPSHPYVGLQFFVVWQRPKESEETFRLFAVSYRRIRERCENDPVQAQSFSNGNIFPNLSMISSGAAFLGRGLIQWHPRGPLLSEGWEWCVVEKDAPKIVKEQAIKALMTRQSAAG